MKDSPPTLPANWPRMLAWLPVPVLLAVILGLWLADLQTVYESWLVMVLLNVFFTWLASVCICVLTARGFLHSGRPGLLMFGCGALLWGVTSLAAAVIVDRVNPTITVHNLGVLVAAFCHLVGVFWAGRLRRPGRWLLLGYSAALLVSALIFWAAIAGWTPVFFVQGRGGTPIRQVVLLLAIALFAWVASQMLYRFRQQATAFYYWYGLGLALVATGLTGVVLLSVQGGVLGWTNRLTQYLGSAYLFVAALMAAREAGSWTFSLAAVDDALQNYWFPAESRRRQPWRLALRYGGAVAAVAAGFGLRLALEARVGAGLPPYITFYPVIMVVSLLAGFGPCLVAMAATVLVVGYAVLPPVGESAFTAPVERLGMVVFAGMSLLMGAAAELHRRYRDKAAAYDREAALRETRREREFLANLLDLASQAFAVGYPDGRLGRVNRAYQQLTGYTAEELRTLDWSTVLTPPEWRAREQQQLAELHRTGRPVRYEKEYIRKDGSRVPVELLVHLVTDAAGQPEYYYSFLADISQRKRAEAALVQAKAAAEAASLAKSRFLANMSHELRTPMNAILGMIDVALPKAADPTVQDCLQTAKGSADLLLTLLNDLLDSAKIESGKLELESAPFSLRRMLEQLNGVLAVRANEKGLAFHCHTSDATPDAVVGDRTRLQQVLLNLAGNAVKFTPQGEVAVRVERLGSSAVGPGPSHETLDSQDPRHKPQDPCPNTVLLRFSVSDTGIGIPPSAQERLFQPFAQADTSMARRFGGTGLGLAISKSLVELMGGRIGLESAPGRGSTFHFTVPLPLAAALPTEFEAPATPPAAAGRRLRILLAEDNPANQKLASYVLQDRGHQVEIAHDGQTAVLMAAQNRYDVLLMDVQMPGMNGLDATAAIRRREAGDGRVPIIALTAHAMQGDRDRCLAAGMDAYLSKPINAQVLIGLVENLARGAAPAAAAPGTADDGPSAAPAVFDRETAVARCCKNPEMLRQMVEYFFVEADNLFPQIRAALDRGDLMEVGRLGHRMKGTVVYLAAQPAEDAARQVERFCTTPGGTLAEAAEAIRVLEHECARLRAALNG